MKYVVLTRSLRKDEGLIKRLERQGIPFASVVLLEHNHGPDFPKLAQQLSRAWDWVAVTSPTAARFFLGGWKEAGRPRRKIAAIGKGTAKVLIDEGVKVTFIASQAYGESLAAELGERGRVLWPTSLLADTHFADELSLRGFEVKRLNVYTTEATVLNEQEKALLDGASLAAFASPSAVRAWMDASEARPPAAAIGKVTARAARAGGFDYVSHPQKPSLEGWAETIAAIFTRG